MSTPKLLKPLYVWTPGYARLDKDDGAYTAPRGIDAKNVRFVGDGWLVDLDVELDGVFVTLKSSTKPQVG